MSRYNGSFYFNSEGYYDPTAGKALTQIIREEKARRKPVKQFNVADNVSDMHYNDPVLDFAQWYAVEYTRTHGLRTSKHAMGKPKVWGDPKRIRKHLNIYLYCMEHYDDDDFCPETAAIKCGFLPDKGQKKIRQIFSGTGNMKNLIDAWYYWNDNIRKG